MTKQVAPIAGEILFAVAGGGAIAWFLPPNAMTRIDEMVVTFLSIVLAAVIPGVALTAGTARPPAATARDARKFGERLADQVGFWFSFLWLGALAVGTVVLGRALEWKLSTPRPSFIPEFVPPGGAWLVFAGCTLVLLIAIRSRHVSSAVKSLVAVGTDVHAEQVSERERAIQAEVKEDLAGRPRDETRGKELPPRPRH